MQDPTGRQGINRELPTLRTGELHTSEIGIAVRTINRYVCVQEARIEMFGRSFLIQYRRLCSSSRSFTEDLDKLRDYL